LHLQIHASYLFLSLFPSYLFGGCHDRAIPSRKRDRRVAAITLRLHLLSFSFTSFFLGGCGKG